MQGAVNAVEQFGVAHHQSEAVGFDFLDRLADGGRCAGQWFRWRRGGDDPSGATLALAAAAAGGRAVFGHQHTFIELEQAGQLLYISVALDGATQVADQRHDLFSDLGLDFGVIQIAVVRQTLHHMNHNWAGGGDQGGPVFRVFINHIVGVHAFGQGGDADVGLQAAFLAQQVGGIKAQVGFPVERLAGDLQAAQRCFCASGVGIERQDHAAADAFQLTQLVVGQGGAHRGDQIGEPGLIGGDHIQIALDDHDLIFAADRFAGFVEAVEQVAFIEQHALRRVEVFGHVIGLDGACAKTGHFAALVADRENDAIAEAVVVAAFVAFGYQPGGQQVVFAVAFV